MSLPNIEDALAWEYQQDPKNYIVIRPFHIGDPGYDCSALQLLALQVMCEKAGKPPDYLFPADGYGNTVSMYEHARDMGWLVSVARGISMRGDIMLKGRTWGDGAAGHTSMSEGDSYQFAARSRTLGIARSPIFGGDDYQDAIEFPPHLVFYPQRDVKPVDPKVLAWLAHLVEWEKTFDAPRTPIGLHGYLQKGDTNWRVTTLVNMLILRGLLNPAYKTNTYTKYVARAVRNVQHSLPGPHVSLGNRSGLEVARWLINPT